MELQKNVQRNCGNMYKNSAVKITTGTNRKRMEQAFNNQKHS